MDKIKPGTSKSTEVDITDAKKEGEAPIHKQTDKTPLITKAPDAKPEVATAVEKDFKGARYAATKSSGHAATNLALITSNAAQLKNVFNEGATTNYYYFFVPALIVSIIAQVIVGFLLIWLGSREAKLGSAVTKGTKKTKRMGKNVMIIVFFVSMLNIIMNAFTVTAHPSPKILPVGNYSFAFV